MSPRRRAEAVKATAVVRRAVAHQVVVRAAAGREEDPEAAAAGAEPVVADLEVAREEVEDEL